MAASSLAAGCCYGSPTDEPWGVVFMNPESLAPLGIALHPAQLYEFLFLIPLGAYLFRRNVNARGNAGSSQRRASHAA